MGLKVFTSEGMYRPKNVRIHGLPKYSVYWLEASFCTFLAHPVYSVDTQTPEDYSKRCDIILSVITHPFLAILSKSTCSILYSKRMYGMNAIPEECLLRRYRTPFIFRLSYANFSYCYSSHYPNRIIFFVAYR
jgi:hypothetical protein